MSSVDRQNKLIVAEDWKRVYQSFKNADFKSYDFDSLRRTMITYLRENYPEDFNDYIESSEYLALIDLISFLGQNLAFRFDLNARENFIELAERKESVLRLARLLGYSAKRCQPARGLLKVVSVTTSESIIDSNGRDLAEQNIIWNDPTNTNWYEQFIKVLNASMQDNSQFGSPQDEKVLEGIRTQQYRFNSSSLGIPVYSFDKNIDGRNMTFEVVSSTFKDSDKIYEEAPLAGNKLAFTYRDDGKGAASSNTGFFFHFRQGELQENSFSIDRPSTNETIDIETTNINQDDIWLYSTNENNVETELWTKVESAVGSNVIYNSLSKNIRNIYSAITRTDDKVRLIFADGVFGNIPQGNFKLYYRSSNGISYSIDPSSIRNVSISVPYISKRGKLENITLTMALRYTVSNAAASESIEEIKQNAPAVYYTQNRMITAEDYNLVPASTNQEILKSKAVNRTSSGISRYFDLKDSTGKYSNTNIFGVDGMIYRERTKSYLTFTFETLTDIEAILIDEIEGLIAKKTTRDFYLSNFPYREIQPEDLCFFTQVTDDINQSTGVLLDKASEQPVVLGDYTSSVFRSIKVGAMLKFLPPADKVFDENNNIVDASIALDNTKTYIWTKVVNIVGDGTAGEDNTLFSGYGPVVFNDSVPTGAVLSSIIPRFVTTLDDGVKSRAIDFIFSHREFALRYDQNETKWAIISGNNVNKNSNFNLGKSGDISGTKQDASWLILFETDGKTYTVTYLGTRYVFESEKEVRFFFDSTDKVYDSSSGLIIKDKIRILDINKSPDSTEEIAINLDWEITEEYKGADGYIDTKKISVSFFDGDDDGVVDDPSMFKVFVNEDVNIQNKIIFQQIKTGLDGVEDFYYWPEGKHQILVFEDQDHANRANVSDEQLVYILNENLVKQYYTSLTTFVIKPEYRGLFGRANVKFQYVHNADNDARLDPSPSNIIDIYILTKAYDTEYKRWLKGDQTTKPLPPSTDSLYVNFSEMIEKNKSISDEVIYHPVKFKNLFGPKADISLQASFKVIKNPSLVISDSEIKAGVLEAINEFFDIENWDFGDTFYFAELSTYIMNKLSPRISNLVIVPKRDDLSFGSLYEIKSNSDEIFANACTVDDIEIISEITANKIKSVGPVLTSLIETQTGISSR